MNNFYGTTIICVKTKDSVSLGGDGQVTLGNTIIKYNACKIRKIFNNKILIGFAGVTADAITILELLELKINKYNGDLKKSSVELTKEWRLNRSLRFESMLLVTNYNIILIITGNGDVLQPSENVAAIGSGADIAKSAALALIENSDLSSYDIVNKTLSITSKLCIYTNTFKTIYTLKSNEK